MTVTITSIEGNTQSLDGGAMYGNAPRAVWEKWTPPDALGRIRLHCRAMLIEVDGVRVLCETGIGAFFEPRLRERYGVNESEHCLLQNLSALGLGEEDIDWVILSHLHFDHAGGLLPPYERMAKGEHRLLFPRARYVVGRRAWQRALAPHPRDRASFIPELMTLLQAAGDRLVVVDGDHVPGLWEGRLSFRISDGHTPGQLHTVMKGDQATVVFAGDLVPGVPWVHVPITMGYDRYAELVIDEKQKLYEDFAGKNWFLFFTHDPDVSLARVGMDDKKKFAVTETHAALRQFPL